jgi:AmmeMemoRadiSam system protein B
MRCGYYVRRIIVACMNRPRELAVREPAFAGLFYPQDAASCRRVAGEMLRRSPLIDSEATPGTQIAPRWLGAIVPHAGWVCSGAVAGEAIGTLRRGCSNEGRPDVVVVFGAIHSSATIERAALDEYDRWLVPGDGNDVSRELRAKLAESRELFAVDNRFHRREHAVEVELPLIEAAWPGITILPVEVPLVDEAVPIGIDTARKVNASGLSAVYLASSDLTHYGPAYHFVPAGAGVRGLAWAKDNDRRLLERVERFAIDQIVPSVRDEYNACGGGAIAAMLAASRESGATHARVLRHTNSFEVLSELSDRDDQNAVGYAAVVVG